MAELALRHRGRATSLCVRFAITLASTVSLLACGHSSSPTAPSVPNNPSSPSTPAPGPAASAPAVLVGAGDIALCGPHLVNAELTARLLDAIPGTIFTAGDNTQDRGTMQEFNECFAPTWGRHKNRIRPAPGNHDFGTPQGADYFAYFGAAAGSPGEGYYSYELGAWHVVSLNSNLSLDPGSPQASWLRNDLQANRKACTAAYWHHPLNSSGPNGGTQGVRHAWELLYEFGAEIVMNGHDHLFERFAPQDPSGRADPQRGIRQFTVGTGGIFLYAAPRPQPNSEVRSQTHGVLKLTLRSDGYDWEFVPVAGSSFSDAGSGPCR